VLYPAFNLVIGVVVSETG